MLEWNKTLRKTEYPTYFTCPVCKIGTNMSIFNPRSGRHVYKYSRLGKSLLKRLEKIKSPMYIVNLKSGRLIKRTSKLGKKIIEERHEKRIMLCTI
jgi:hypothetical protein